ncbi:MAG: hypothetical protein GY807_12450 [Gammaproteobacteria bacterium]|nr:hypothetical protein [Gammaproteobacteria bacterium]
MDENEYRVTYQQVNTRRCIFEKALNSRVCACEQSQRFNIADREGVACRSPSGQVLCNELIQLLRHNVRFALHMNRITGPLPHAREIKVQNGGLLGLQKLLLGLKKPQDGVENINGLVRRARDRFGRLADVPFNEIVQSVVSYNGRRRRSGKR